MISNMFAEFKTDIMQSVTEAVESSINEWYEENDYGAEDEHVVDNTIDVNALMQTVLASNKSQASTFGSVKTVKQPKEFETLLTELNPEKVNGPPPCEKLGVLVNSLLKEVFIYQLVDKADSKEMLTTLTHAVSLCCHCPQIDSPI